MFETIMASTVVSSVIGLITVIVTQKMARRTARETTSAEMEKLKQTWRREDNAHEKAAFDALIDSVTIWATAIGVSTPKTLAAIRRYQADTSGEISFALDNLYNAVSKGQREEAADLLAIVVSVRQRSV